MILAHVESRHEQESLSYRALCQREGVAYPTLMRWRGRVRHGKALARRPGPQKHQQADLQELEQDLKELRHSKKRSRGAGKLHEKYRHAISRRDLDILISRERQEHQRAVQGKQRTIHWKVPGLIWAMDDCHNEQGACLHVRADLSGRYLFPVVHGESLLKGEDVAPNLEELFKSRGAPLVLKRDNGGNLCHHEVNRVLDRYHVLALTSPTYYPQYNGGIERAQGILKEGLVQSSFPSCCKVVETVHRLNHRPRRVLGGKTPCECQAEARSNARSFTPRNRKEIAIEIHRKTLALASRRKYDVAHAWRVATESWLESHGIIAINET